MTPADAEPPTLAQLVRPCRDSHAAAAPAAPMHGLEVSEIDSDTTFDRLFGPDTPPQA